jgi:hypothetical protein
MTAASVPIGLKFQLLAPLSPTVISHLFSRILLAVRGSVNKGSAADRDGVASALATSGLVISQNIISEEQQSQIWFSSKWAMRIVNKMSFKTGSKTDSATSYLTSHMDVDSTDVSKPAPECHFEENHRLTGALCQLWSVLLPHAVFSPGSDANSAVAGGDCIVGNKAWKAVSFLAFGSTAYERLWVAVERPVKGSTVPVRAPDVHKAPARGSLTGDSENEKKNEGKSQSSAFGGLMSVFGFSSSSGSSSSSGANSGKGKKGAAASKERDDSSNKRDGSANNRADEKHLSISSGVDVEDYASYTFNPAIHLDPQCLDFRFSILITFATVLKTILAATDDYEFYSLQKPFPLVQYIRIIRTFKTLLYRILKYDPTLALEQSTNAMEKTEKLYCFGCVRSISGVLSDLYLRWARRPFSAASVWVLEDSDSPDMRSEIRNSSPFAVSVLREMPWSLNFYERMKIFREVVDEERLFVQGTDPHNSRETGVRVRVRRTHILLDGMAAFEKAGGAIKNKIIVKYINAFGDEESGTLHPIPCFVFSCQVFPCRVVTASGCLVSLCWLSHGCTKYCYCSSYHTAFLSTPSLCSRRVSTTFHSTTTCITSLPLTTTLYPSL